MKEDTDIVICMGPILSGKTTWSWDFFKENPDYYRIGLDEVRLMMRNELTEVDESFMRIFFKFIMSIAFRHKKVLLDDIYLDMNTLKVFADYCNLTIKMMDITMQEAMVRNVVRKKEKGIWVDPLMMREYRDYYKEFIESPEFEELIMRPNVIPLIGEARDVNRSFVDGYVF